MPENEGAEKGAILPDGVPEAEPAGPVYKLSDEEKSAFTEVYAAALEGMESGDYSKLSEVMDTHFDVFYELNQAEFGGGYMVFDGNTLKTELDGFVLAMKSRNYEVQDEEVRNYGEIYYTLTGYLGEFVKGRPNGTCLGLDTCDYTKSHVRKQYTDVTEAEYEDGVLTGSVTGSQWGRKSTDLESHIIYRLAGSYDEYREPYGNFNFTIYDTRSVSANLDVEKYKGIYDDYEYIYELDGPLEFNVILEEIDESNEFYEQMNHFTNDFLVPVSGILYCEKNFINSYRLFDDTGIYTVDASYLLIAMDNAGGCLWKGIVTDEGASAQTDAEETKASAPGTSGGTDGAQPETQ